MNPSECLQDAMGMIDERFVAEVTEHCPLTAAPRRPWVRWVTAVAACLCLAVGIGAAVRMLPMQASKDMKSESLTLAVDPNEVIWLDPSLDIYYSAEKPEIAGEDAASVSNSLTSKTTAYGGWRMSDTLEKALALAGNSDTRFAILVSPVLHGETFDAFVYQGRTYTEWETYREACFAEQEKRLMLLKEGEALKYGEALYTTGTPEGEKWAKSLYDERVAYYGAEFLARYIVDGELLAETLEREAAEYLTEYESVAYILSDLVTQYRAEQSLAVAAQLTEQGLLCEVRRGRLFLFATPRQLKQVRNIDKDEVTLTAASRRMYDEAYDLFNSLDTTVSGFNTDILYITTDYVRSHVMRDDADVIDAIRYLYDHFQHDDGYLDVSIDCGDTLTDEYLAGYGWEVVYRGKYISNIHVRVPFDKFDLQLLCDLSNRTDVTYIHIGPPAVPDTAG